MPTMTAPAKALPASQPGLYVVEIEPGMAGNWALQVAAKVQGETRDGARRASRQTREMTCARPALLAAGIVIVITCGALHPARAQDGRQTARRHARGAAGRKPAAQPQPARRGARYRGRQRQRPRARTRSTIRC